MNARKDPSSEAAVRDRLLDAADRLFYQEGIRAVGIDRVLAEAGAAKASLYQHFGSKDELVAAFIERRTLAAREAIEAFVAPYPAEQQALRVFDFVIDWVSNPEFRGCPVQHLVGEFADECHPARGCCVSQRAWLLGRLTDWAAAAGATEPARIAGALMVLFDGAIAASEQDGPERARDARWAAERLLQR